MSVYFRKTVSIHLPALLIRRGLKNNSERCRVDFILKNWKETLFIRSYLVVFIRLKRAPKGYQCGFFCVIHDVNLYIYVYNDWKLTQDNPLFSAAIRLYQQQFINWVIIEQKVKHYTRACFRWHQP